MTPAAKYALRALLAVGACALLLPLAAPAATSSVATTPCWVSLMNEWYGGRITTIYPVPCYRQAIDHLPTDVSVYSSARDDIEHALQLAIAHSKNPSAPAPTITTTGPGGSSAGGSSTGAKGATSATGPGRTNPSGPIPSIINNSSPGGATSFPLPLIILGGLAIFLLAAGGVGLIIRRMQGRGGPGTS